MKYKIHDLKIEGYAVLSKNDLKRMLKSIQDKRGSYTRGCTTGVFYAKLIHVKGYLKNNVQIQFKS